jgi:hypothetical protein
MQIEPESFYRTKYNISNYKKKVLNKTEVPKQRRLSLFVDIN